MQIKLGHIRQNHNLRMGNLMHLGFRKSNGFSHMKRVACGKVNKS